MIKVVYVSNGTRNEKLFMSMDGTAGAEAFMRGLKESNTLKWWEEVPNESQIYGNDCRTGSCT
jgi:hypothetical protein